MWEGGVSSQAESELVELDAFDQPQAACQSYDLVEGGCSVEGAFLGRGSVAQLRQPLPPALAVTSSLRPLYETRKSTKVSYRKMSTKIFVKKAVVAIIRGCNE